MIFGIYPGSIAGTDKELTIGKPDKPKLVNNALNEMEKNGRKIIIRGYIQYLGNSELDFEAPRNILQYSTDQRKIDLVLCYRAEKYDQNDWTTTIKRVIDRFGPKLHSLQITEEPNLKVSFAGDGGFENIETALHDGILAAKKEISRLNQSIKIGFNVVPSFNPTDDFWKIIGGNDFKLFRESIDYVGLDFYPDVFRPVAEDGQPNDLEESVKIVLGHFRNVNLKTGKIPISTPIHITENGWSTGKGKSHERQAVTIEKIIRTVNDLRTELNITHYEFFSLRDTDTNNNDLFYQFGLLKDDYSPKQAFNIFCKLVDELGIG